MEDNSQILPVVGYGSPILREVCVEAENNAESQIVVQNLIKTVSSIGIAVGLAAPQINSNLRMFVINYNGIKVVLNPIIKKARGEKKSSEGCLSIAGITATVPNRNEIIDVEFYDQHFNHKKLTLRGFEAIIFQHEFHHLNGILFTDLLTKEGQEQIKDKLSDIEKGIFKASYPLIFLK